MGPMSVTETGSDAELLAARDAAARRDWPAAFEAFSAVDARAPLAPEDLERVAKAAWWTGRSNESIEARERAFAGYLHRGETERAAFCALTLRREYAAKLASSVAQGWLSRAERLLADSDGTAAHAYLAIAHAEAAWHGGDFDGALAQLDRATELAGLTGERDLLAWAVMRRGEVRFAMGDVEGGWKLLEEVAVAAVGGELGGYTTGAVFCNVISTCRERVDLARGKEWGDAAKRWCDRQAISGFPGVCRIRRAEIMRLLGSLTDAEREIRQACEELPPFSPYFTGEAFHELGEVRLRLGDLADAEEAFREARAFGSDPQPGEALLLLATGRTDAAAASIRGSLEGTDAPLARARLLPALVEIGRAREDVASVADAAAELESIAGEFPIAAIEANGKTARGVEDLLRGATSDAAARFRSARQQWRAIDSPYEVGRTSALLAEALAAGGDVDAASIEIETARSTFERLGAAMDERAAMLRAATWSSAPTDATVVERTLMFTDIVGSTALLEAIGDEAWTSLRRWHDQALRACVERHGGDEVDHTGDGFFLAFEDAGAAVACAIDIQRLLAEHRRDHGFAPQIRIGIHAAETTSTGGNYTGKGVHAAARVGAIGGAGEIVASAETIQGLTGVATTDRRSVELKGLATPVEVVSIEWREAGP